MDRRYRDKFGVVHQADDLGLGNRITWCERLTKGELYDTRELLETQEELSCLFCLCSPRVTT
jgi:hypothetical protein